MAPRTALPTKNVRYSRSSFATPVKVIERDVFLKTIWEEDGFFVARSMDVFVSKLRKYLRADAGLRIENVRGIGYILKQGEQDLWI